MTDQERLEKFCNEKGWTCTIYGGRSSMAVVHIYVGDNATFEATAHSKEGAAEQALNGIKALRRGRL